MTNRTRWRGLVAGLLIAAAAGAFGEATPDARELLAQAIAAVAPPVARVRYDVRAVDGKGGEARSQLLHAAEGKAGGRALAYVKKSATMPEAGFYAAAGADGALSLVVREKGKTRAVAAKKAGDELGATGIPIEDLLPRALPDKVAITVGVVYHGAPCWIVRGEFEGKGRTAPIVRYWVRKDHPRLLQVEWRDGKDRPVRQVAIVPGEAGGVGFAERITVRPAEGGAWTELVAQASAFDAFPDLGGAPESAFDDPEKLDAQWP